MIIMFCIMGVYEVNNSVVEVWIMIIMGGVGYGLRGGIRIPDYAKPFLISFPNAFAALKLEARL
jgi:TctA family transporter